MLYVPSFDEFAWRLDSFAAGTRPVAAMGTSVTPSGGGVFGSWTQLIAGASVTDDVYGILINMNSANTSGATRNLLMDIGVDPAGGTSYTTIIPYLMGGHASGYTTNSGGIWYYFPLFIKAGSSIACRGMASGSTAVRCFVSLFGRPKFPDRVKCGAYVTCFGTVDTANAAGVATVPGTTSDGAWADLGATTKDHWWFQVGHTYVNITINAAALHVDVGAGNATNKRIVLQDAWFQETTAEIISNLPVLAGCSAFVPSGQNIYVRKQTSGTVTTTCSSLAYGLGG